MTNPLEDRFQMTVLNSLFVRKVQQEVEEEGFEGCVDVPHSSAGSPHPHHALLKWKCSLLPNKNPVRFEEL